MQTKHAGRPLAEINELQGGTFQLCIYTGAKIARMEQWCSCHRQQSPRCSNMGRKIIF
jgi:hypothetical protein